MLGRPEHGPIGIPIQNADLPLGDPVKPSAHVPVHQVLTTWLLQAGPQAPLARGALGMPRHTAGAQGGGGGDEERGTGGGGEFVRITR
jgi:hypothetical protein